MLHFVIYIYLILITSLTASLCHFLLTVSESGGVAADAKYFRSNW